MSALMIKINWRFQKMRLTKTTKPASKNLQTSGELIYRESLKAQLPRVVKIQRHLVFCEYCNSDCYLTKKENSMSHLWCPACFKYTPSLKEPQQVELYEITDKIGLSKILTTEEFEALNWIEGKNFFYW